MYSMTPIANGTRLRKDHNTFSAVLDSFNRGQVLVGDEIWTAPADGAEVRKGDVWLHVTQVDRVNLPLPAWVARTHKGVPICDNFKVLEDAPPPPVPQFPLSFELKDPATGKVALYVFEKVLE